MSLLKSVIGVLETIGISPGIAGLLVAYIQYLEGQAEGRYRSIPETIRALLSSSYPGVDLEEVLFADNIDTIHGMAITFGSRIYFPSGVDPFRPDDLRWLLHELQHCRQYAEAGGIPQFLTRYLASAAQSIVAHRTFNVHDFVSLEKEAKRAELAATPRALVDPG